MRNESMPSWRIASSSESQTFLSRWSSPTACRIAATVSRISVNNQTTDFVVVVVVEKTQFQKKQSESEMDFLN
jgi:hypothetical protein